MEAAAEAAAFEVKTGADEVSCSRLLVSGHRRIEKLDSQRKLRRSR